jgi:hypothetical protein
VFTFLSAGLRDGGRRQPTGVRDAKRRGSHYRMVTVRIPIESAYHGALCEEIFFPRVPLESVAPSLQ